MRTVDGSRFGKLVLALVLVWALVAVLLLTGTLTTANSIDEEVGVITDRTSEIDRDLEAIGLAERTARISRRILHEVRPLDNRLGEVVDETASIERSADSILAKSRAINATARSINATVGSINATVVSLAGTVFSIEGTVHSINASAGAIEGDTGRIESNLTSVFAETRSIDVGVKGINLHARGVIAVVGEIEEDLTRVRRELGPGHGDFHEDLTIHGHAHDIDCTFNREKEYCRR